MLKVPEYFLFDPFEEYLKPSMQGYRLLQGAYVGIEPVQGRLPSEALGLHLEREGTELRLFDPKAGRRLLKLRERLAQADLARGRVEAENERLRRELEALRRPPERS